MDSPPAKRQRRLKAVFSSDNEEELNTVVQEPASRQTASALVTSSGELASLRKFAKSSGLKSKPKPNANASKVTPREAVPKAGSASPIIPKKSPRRKKVEENSKSLHTFFNRASEEQRWERKANTPTQEVDDVESGNAFDDDDDSLDEDFFQPAKDREGVKSQLDRRKGTAALSENGSERFRANFPASTHKFVKPAVPSIKKKTIKLEIEDNSNAHLHRPWADQYGPATLEELAVHKKKVADVQKWLGEALIGKPHKILILKGPAGSGKTTCVTLLSATFNFQALHWSNPTVSDTSMSASVASQFDDFVNRSTKFSCLDLHTPAISLLDAQADDQSETSSRVLVVEEFPTNLTRSSSALEAFRGVLSRYLATGPSSSNPTFRKGVTLLEPRPPLVLIISESLLTSATTSADSFTAHRLLGPEIMSHPLVTVMEFNAVAPTFVGKALDFVIKKEARDSQRRRIPGPAILKKLSEMGDIRSAINALEFICARSANNDDWSGTVATKMKKSNRDGVALTPMERNSLKLVTQRESTLGMFHAVAKVVYNKREDAQITDPHAQRPPKPPDHLAHMDKPKVAQTSIDDLMNETGTDISTFLSTLHENYVLSCNGLSFLESCGNCITALSDSDVLSAESRSVSKIGYGCGPARNGLSHVGGIDVFRQNEISFHVAVRGLLFSLPQPVNRAAYPGNPKRDMFKMFYPASLRLWKPMEETDSLLSLLMDQSMFGGGRDVVCGKSSAHGVASWKQTNNTFDASAEGEENLSIPRILASRADMLYDRLPYLSRSHISRGLDMRTVKQVTQFRGAALQNEDDSAEGEMEVSIDLSAADESTDRVTTSPKRRDRILMIGPERGSGNSAMLNNTVNHNVELEKLYISDDDIQDD